MGSSYEDHFEPFIGAPAVAQPLPPLGFRSPMISA
jgi:hypothetical protein